MKIAPLYRELSKETNFECQIIHTGQHYDQNMSGIFFDQLGIPEPNFRLNVGSGTHAYQTGNTMIGYEKICLEIVKPDLLIVVGDVNATIACALAAKKIGIKLAHLEAGLRSNDRSMPEELNRILTDTISDILWTPSPDADENLKAENVSTDKITFVGNIMIDTLLMMMPEIEKSEILETKACAFSKYALLTLHRPANVDDLTALIKIFSSMQKLNIDVIMPVHPRTKKYLSQLPDGCIPNNIHLIAPLPYVDFMKLVKNCEFVLTDSGGLQEETTFLNIPCFTLRHNTERPITISQGTNTLVNVNNFEQALHLRKNATHIEKWDGNTAKRIVVDLKERLNVRD